MALDALWGFFSFMGRVRKEFSEVAAVWAHYSRFQLRSFGS